jgi:hypothetical protein
MVGLVTFPPAAMGSLTSKGRRQDVLLRQAEVQYGCRDAARQSYGQHIREPAALHPASKVGISRKAHEAI